jgi:hypothetical protein
MIEGTEEEGDVFKAGPKDFGIMHQNGTFVLVMPKDHDTERKLTDKELLVVALYSRLIADPSWCQEMVSWFDKARN